MSAEDQGAGMNEEDRQLSSVALEIVDTPDVEATEVDRFFGQVRAIAECRAQSGWSAEGDAPLAVFVRSAYPRAAAGHLKDSKACADLIATSEPILGRIHVLNFDASQGRSAPLTGNSAGEVVEWLTDQPFSSDQIIILYRESLQLVERAGGVAGGTTRLERIRLAPPDLTQAELIEALDTFHRRTVLTPSMCPKDVWRVKHAQQYHPAPRPEKAIQDCLKVFLVGWWRGLLRAECEDEIGIGRIDIRLLRPDPLRREMCYWSIIELKIVKSFRYPSANGTPDTVTDLENAQVVAQGVEQASDFARDRGVFGVLEIYDMRKDKKMANPISHALVVHALADHYPNPVMRLTPLFGSADHARHAGYA